MINLRVFWRPDPEQMRQEQSGQTPRIQDFFPQSLPNSNHFSNQRTNLRKRNEKERIFGKINFIDKIPIFPIDFIPSLKVTSEFTVT
jgi:hypothetical protein